MQPKRLPTVELSGKRYFVDERLSQVRNIHNPHDFYDVPPEMIARWRAQGRLKESA